MEKVKKLTHRVNALLEIAAYVRRVMGPLEENQKKLLQDHHTWHFKHIDWTDI